MTRAQATTQSAAGEVPLRGRAGATILGATVLGAGVAQLDATVVNVALPALGRDLDAGLGSLQWVLDGYLLALAALILLGGALGDRLGRRRMYVVGIGWFMAASLACALAPSVEILVAARVLQGVGAALLTPGSLAIIEATFRHRDRPTAIGAWAALSGVAVALGPVLGGWLVDVASWRWVFIINLPIGAAAIAATVRHVPESRDPDASGRPDVGAAALSVLGLGGVTFALIEASSADVPRWTVWGAVAAGALALAGVVALQRREANPLIPLELFASRQFTAANAITLLVYATLGGVLFLFVVYLQNSLGYSATRAGAASLPITAVMLALSSPSGALARRIGPRAQLTVGPVLLAGGVWLLGRAGPDADYWTDLLPALLVLALGLAAIVAPVTSLALAAGDPSRSGSASGINNAVARTGQLVAVAGLPLAAGLAGDDYRDPRALADGFGTAMTVAAGAAVAAALIAALLVRGNPLADDERS